MTTKKKNTTNKELTPRQEAYCHARAEGKSQREAYRSAYPKAVAWKNSAVDSQACRLEAIPKVSARLKALMREAAERAVVTRAEIIDAQGLLLRKGVDAVKRHTLADKEMAPAVKAVTDASDRLMQWLPEEASEAEGGRVFDFSMLLGRDFVDFHRDVAAHRHREYILPGGRGSLKTTTVAEEVVAGVVSVQGRNALCMRNRTNKLQTSVVAECKKAARRLGVFDEFRWTASPMRAVHKPTGNVIYFFGCDSVAPEDSALKSFAPDNGYIAYLWFEEASQFPGYKYIRTVKQTVLRGTDLPTWTFITYNPPISANAWVNREEREEADGRAVYRSHWRNVPPEWLGESFIAEAEALYERNPRAAEHEYDGKATGTGANVIDPSIIEVREVTAEERARLSNVAHGVDAGTVHPWVHERVAYDTEAMILYVLDEDVRQGSEAHDTKTAPLLEERLAAWGELNEDLWCDSAAAGMVQYYQEYGLNARNCYKQGANSPRERVRWMNRMARIVIDKERCPLAAEQFRNLEYVITPSGEITETLPKVDDDAVDAVGYAAGVWIKQRM